MGRRNQLGFLHALPAVLAASLVLAPAFGQDTPQPQIPTQSQTQTQSPAQSVPQSQTQLPTQPGQPPPPPDDQASTVRTVRLSDVEGRVQIYRAEDLAFPQADVNMPLTEGMRVVTAADGRAEIQFEDGSVVRVAPNSSILLASLTRNPDGSTATEVTALTGLSYYEVNGHGAGQFAVEFGSDTAVPIGSAVLRVDLDSNPAKVADLQGQVQFLSGQSALLTSNSGQTVSFNTADPAQYTTVNTIAADSWDQWNADRDQQLTQLAQDETTARAGTGDPNDPAWNDLDYYGDWYDVPGYGQGWAPAGVSANWDPFGDGSWGYYPSFGYTWISAYPWGWWPYHCGAWDWMDSYGWLWFPGNCGLGSFGGGWYPYAGVWRVPPGYRPPVRPPHRPHTGSGPEPLIAVSRGPQFAGDFRTLGGAKPPARSLQFNQTTIYPENATIHPAHPGPTGDTFVSALRQTHPEVKIDPRFATPTTSRTVYVPRNAAPGWRPGSTPAPIYRPGNSQPRYEPAPSFHPSGPPPSGGGGGHPSSSGGSAHH